MQLNITLFKIADALQSSIFHAMFGFNGGLKVDLLGCLWKCEKLIKLCIDV